MLFTISMLRPATGQPATDLGFLLYKHPDKVSEFDLSFGKAIAFFPEATPERCTAALILEIDQQRLAKQARHGQLGDFALAAYVNDRSYAASSLLSAALSRVFSTARSGRCDARPELAAASVPLEIDFPVMPCRGGPEMARRVFEPLGWAVTATPIPLDARFPEWGDSPYVHLRLKGKLRLADALNQLTVLVPVLDEAKHYWQSDDEVDKLLRAGEGWLSTHPERDLITRKYLAVSRDLTNDALNRLADRDFDSTSGVLEPLEPTNNLVVAFSEPQEPQDCGAIRPSKPSLNRQVSPPLAAQSSVVEQRAGGERPSKPPTSDSAHNASNPTPLRSLRHQAVIETLLNLNAKLVIDLGCGPGDFMLKLADQHFFTKITGVDVSTRALQIAAKRLHFDDFTERQAERISLFQGALTYADERFSGYDAAILMEVIEHLDLDRLPALEQVVFGGAHPKAIIVTTPNAEYNFKYDNLAHDELRHTDHRFEWDRAEFQQWANRVAAEYGYNVTFSNIGEPDAEAGAPTQMGVFTRA